jgi:SAM-dependent methyltransferase
MSSTRPCPACTSVTIARRFSIPEQMFGLNEAFDYLECVDCGTVFIAEVPADLAKYYDADAYYSFDSNPESTMGRPGVRHLTGLIGRSVLFGPAAAVARAAALSPMRELRTLVSVFSAVRLAGLPRGSRSRVLDVGTGSGTLLYALDLAGLSEVLGIDPFAEADKRVGRKAQLLRRDLSEVDGQFDLLMMHHSLEHVPDPAATLRRARTLLSANGRVLVRMPTVSSRAYDDYGVSWIGCDAPRHLTLFSRSGVDRICERTGFRIRAVVDDSNESQFWASEQFRAGVPLTSETSHFVNPGGSMFTRRQIREWRRLADRLNAEGRGDQAAWVLEPID